MELKECRLRLAEERRARLKAESRLMEVINAVIMLKSEDIMIALMLEILSVPNFMS